ncbi:MAG: lysostaphin resistance A-like protein [Candidatus Hermodarchaeota archaeon]
MNENKSNFWQHHLFVSIFVIIALYFVAILASEIIDGILRLDYLFSFFLHFGCLAVSWFLVAPFILNFPNKSESFREYLDNIRLTRVRPFPFTFLLGVIVSLVILVWFIVFVVFTTGSANFRFDYLFPPMATLLFALIPGIFEEIAARGVGLRLLQTKYDNQMAIILSSALFGLAHLFNVLFGASLQDTIPQVGFTFLLGLIFGYIFGKTDSLLPGIILHYLVDSVGAAILDPVFVLGLDPVFRGIILVMGVGVIPCIISFPLIKILMDRWYPLPNKL